MVPPASRKTGMTAAPRVFVTGALGFIGVPTVKALQKRGAHVVAMVRPGRAEEARTVFGDAVDVEEADLFEAEPVRAAVQRSRATHCLHGAWVSTPRTYLRSPTNASYAAASETLWRISVDSGICRLVGVGTSFEGIPGAVAQSAYVTAK